MKLGWERNRYTTSRGVTKVFLKKFLTLYSLFLVRLAFLTPLFEAGGCTSAGTSRRVFLRFSNKMKFYPILQNNNGRVFFNSTLGMVSKYCLNQKLFSNRKLGFLLLTELFKKILMFSSIGRVFLIIKGVPLYLKEILNCLFAKLNKFYKNPFNTNRTIYEMQHKSNFIFTNILFVNNNYRKFTNIKMKKIGRLKRKIKKRIILSNNISDF